MNEHRKEERRKAMIFTPVYDEPADILMGYLGDLTLHGARLVSEGPVDINRKFTLAIEFRKASNAPTQRTVLPARAAWFKQQKSTYYNTGFEFIEISEENRKAIEDALLRYQSNRKKLT